MAHTNALLLVASLLISAQCYLEGDFIQSATRVQFHGRRTQWQDLLGHHCPRYGHHRVVSLPLQKPLEAFSENDDYKIQLSFDGDRHVTPWMKVIGKGAPAAPIVEVVLRRSGQELLGVVAQVEEAPRSFKRSHPLVEPQFRNATYWPKHLPLRYTFDTQNEVDLERGLTVVFVTGLLVSLAIAVNAVWGVGSKLVSFLSEVTGEGEAVADSLGGPAESSHKDAAGRGGRKAE